MRRSMQFLYLFLFGGIAYGLGEVCYRGYTHVSMVLTGGLAFALLAHVDTLPLHFLCRTVIGALMICAFELISGCVVNLWLKLHVWDYSEMPFNFLGQICGAYLCLWIVVSAAALPLARLIRESAFSSSESAQLLLS